MKESAVFHPKALPVRVLFLLAAWAASSASGRAAPTTVAAGYELYESQPGTGFNGIAFQGVPLGTYNFGNGPQNTFQTDTIIQRMAAATPSNMTVSTALVALQLQSTAHRYTGRSVHRVWNNSCKYGIPFSHAPKRKVSRRWRRRASEHRHGNNRLQQQHIQLEFEC